MSDELTRVTAALEALSDDATPEQIAELAHLYSLRDVVAAMFSITDGGGGGGGSQTLAQVLTEGDDAESQNIVGVQELVADAITAETSLVAPLFQTSGRVLAGYLIAEGAGASEASILAAAEAGAAGTKPILRLYDADFNNVVFEVRADGSVHIPTGTAIIADL